MCLLPWSALALAACLAFSVLTGDASDERQTFIVRVQNDLKPSVVSDVENWYSSILRSLRSNPLLSRNTSMNHGETSSNDFLYVYKTVFHGFSAKLTPQEAQELQNRPEVLGVFPDRVHQIHTTRTPQFLGLSAQLPNGLLEESGFGSNVIIGVIDTGIWPERRSFHDQGLGSIPDHWKGECSGGENFSKTLCNKKLVGARYFSSGFQAGGGGTNDTTESNSARDSIGHGTHTSSTAAGRYVEQASLFGYASGVAAGMAPKARIAAYKACWGVGCYESDILAAIDKAVEDGVDVISISLGGPPVTYDSDTIAMGGFAAMEKGVFVSASAGNEGPLRATVSNVAPWLTTVGAGTIDRSFLADVLLGDGRILTGVSLYSGDPLPSETFLSLIYAGNASFTGGGRGGGGTPDNFSAQTCMPGALDPELIRGKIVLCDRGGIPGTLKGVVIKEAGGAGMILGNVAPDGDGLIAEAYFIPTVAITESANYIARGYISSSQNPQATLAFRGTELGVKPAPRVAYFSSRGPNPESQYIIKPDVIAPGVDILAAYPDDLPPSEVPSDTRRAEFNIMSGTSMSCPHVAGVAALLKGAHPDWSPAAIRSAMMTTAYTYDSTGETLSDSGSNRTSNVWDFGSGHLDPERAADPGLVYNLTVDDYLNFLCASGYSDESIRIIARTSVNCTGRETNAWDLNYPSISVFFNQSGAPRLEVSVTRKATSVGEGSSSYRASVESPKGADVSVEPAMLEFLEKGETQTYVVRISANQLTLPAGGHKARFGRLTWYDGKHRVATPIAVTWSQPS